VRCVRSRLGVISIEMCVVMYALLRGVICDMVFGVICDVICFVMFVLMFF